MELNDWVLAFHLLSAVALIGAQVVLASMIVSLWRSDSPSRVSSAFPLARVGTALVMAGSTGTVIFGVWLAISVDAYDLWDGWVIAAFVLWALAGFVGQKSGESYAAGGELARSLAADGTTSSAELAREFGATRAFWLHVAASAIVLLIIVLMIWKPGA